MPKSFLILILLHLEFFYAERSLLSFTAWGDHSIIGVQRGDRDRSYLINEAISIYLEMHQCQVEEIQRGVSEADAGDFATEDEVNAVFARLTNGKAH